MLAIAFLASATHICLAQPARKIARIETEGLQSVTAENVIATSGLKIGDPFSVGELDAAAQRLIDSGLFKNVGYRTRTVGSAVTITFQVEELKSNNSPVFFDNFIWLSDEELNEAVKTVFPSFTGLIPDTGNAAEKIRQALQKLLETRKLPGTIEYTLTETGHLFRVGGAPLNICTLHFPGAHHVSEEKLIQTTKSSTDLNYSRQAAMTFPKYGLFPLYRALGHLKATFGAPVAKPDTNPGCEGGVDLTIPVNEGPVYSWAKAEWQGNQVFAASDLDQALGMKAGEVANGLKFDKGLQQVDKLYGTKGRIQTNFNPEPEFDDAARRVSYRIRVNEGPEYHMGTVEFKGVSDEDAAALKQKWGLNPGAIYDQSYLDRFFRQDAAVLLGKIFQQRRSLEKGKSPLDVRSDVNRKALTVNVIIEIKN